ncbi:carboxylate-amine ligase, partial [Rubrivirga sp.]|uniref:carboxylate-amine ligase n=1 Tax=Rubrivirga sp. TaxID=1885344 RepID=UPI003C74686F
ICDAPSTMKELATLVALVQSLVVAIGDRYDQGAPIQLLKPWILRENKWRAVRHGLDAELICDNEGDHGALRDMLPNLIEELEPTAERLGCLDHLRGVLDILDNGGSSERQRAVYAKMKRLPDVVASLTGELRESVDSLPA